MLGQLGGVAGIGENWTLSVDPAGTPAAGDILLLRVKRVPADAGDTLAADAKLLGIVVTWTQTIGSDA